jgi:cytochrome c oxidase assembly factor CtaG
MRPCDNCAPELSRQVSLMAFPAADTPYAWSLEPQVLLAVAVVGAAYAWRLRDSRSGYLRAAAFAAGLMVLLLALVSPIDSLGEERLFSAHMAQHLLLADVAPILLLLGLSRPIMRPAVRRLQPIERLLGPLAHPLSALVLLVAVVWAWHVPAMYELALRNPWAHQLEHLAFLGAGTAFWWYVIEPVPPRRRLRGMASAGYLAGAKLLLGALGVVLAFSPDALYETYESAPRTWGLSPVEDLNVGGLVMMLEQSIVLVIFFAIVFVRMLEQSEDAERRRERFGL